MGSEDVYSWSRTAASNATADTGINWAEGQPRNSVNNSARSMMAAIAKQFALQTGAIVTTGTDQNIQRFTSGVGYTAMPVNFFCRLKVGASLTNTGPPATLTLSMDGMSAAQVVTANGQPVPAGTFTDGGYVELLWDGSGWWRCLSSTKFSIPSA